jgi:hypothetical protein
VESGVFVWRKHLQPAPVLGTAKTFAKKEGTEMNIVERVKKILLQPGEEWGVIAAESTTTSELYRNYIIPLAAIGPIAFVIGMSVLGMGMPFVGRFRIPIGTAISSAVVQYILSLVGVYVLALIVDYLAPTFSGEKNVNQALKLTAYSMTASWLAGIFILIPALSVLSILLSLYGLYLLYLGIPPLMKAPQEKALPYTIVIVIAAVVIFAILSWVPRAFISYPVPGGHMMGQPGPF